jgi:DCN1-like protein 1/2
MFEAHSAFAPGSSTQDAYLGAWCAFLKKEKKGRSVSKDVWTLFLDFATGIDAKFEKYDIDAAWPSLIDEFVEHAKEKLERGEQLGPEEEEEES